MATKKKLLTSAPEPRQLASPPSTPLLVEAKTDGKCIAALVLGIISVGVLSTFVLLGIFFGVPAVILGILGLRTVKRTGARGHGLAIAGIVLGGIGIVSTVSALVWVVSFGDSII
jgi:hypothetical protein